MSRRDPSGTNWSFDAQNDRNHRRAAALAGPQASTVYSEEVFVHFTDAYNAMGDGWGSMIGGWDLLTIFERGATYDRYLSGWGATTAAILSRNPNRDVGVALNFGQFERAFTAVYSRVRRGGRHRAEVLSAVAQGFSGLYSVDARQTYVGNDWGTVLALEGAALIFINPQTFGRSDGFVAEIFIHEALHYLYPGANRPNFPGAEAWPSQCGIATVAFKYGGTGDDRVTEGHCFF